MGGPGKPENLKPFPKGVSGNPNGRPRKLPALDKLLADVLGFDDGQPEETARAKKILEALYNKALKGDTRAAEILLERGYGKAKQMIEHSGEIGGKHVVEFRDFSKPKK